MANNVKGLSNYLYFSDVTTASTKTGANDYTDVMIPTDTILGIFAVHNAKAIDILFKSLHGDNDHDRVAITVDNTNLSIPQICNELVKFIQAAPGGKMLKVCDVRNGIFALEEITACAITVQD